MRDLRLRFPPVPTASNISRYMPIVIFNGGEELVRNNSYLTIYWIDINLKERADGIFAKDF